LAAERGALWYRPVVATDGGSPVSSEIEGRSGVSRRHRKYQPFPERLRELKTWISEETGPEASIDALMTVIAYFRLPLPKAKQILREVESAVSHWRDVGHSLGMDKRMLKAFTEAFEHPERRAAQRAMW